MAHSLAARAIVAHSLAASACSGARAEAQERLVDPSRSQTTSPAAESRAIVARVRSSGALPVPGSTRTRERRKEVEQRPAEERARDHQPERAGGEHASAHLISPSQSTFGFAEARAKRRLPQQGLGRNHGRRGAQPIGVSREGGVELGVDFGFDSDVWVSFMLRPPSQSAIRRRARNNNTRTLAGRRPTRSASSRCANPSTCASQTSSRSRGESRSSAAATSSRVVGSAGLSPVAGSSPDPASSSGVGGGERRSRRQ